MNTLAKKINGVIDFVITHAEYYNNLERDELERCAMLHAQYGTMLVLHDALGISVVARWNVMADRETIHVIDIVIRPDLRRLKMLRYIAVQIWKLNPNTKFFYYERHRREKSYGFNLRQWLKMEKSHERKIV